MMMCPRPHSLLLLGRPPPWSPRHACSGQAGQDGSDRDHAGQGVSTGGGGGGSTGGSVVGAALLQEVAGVNGRGVGG